MLEGLSFPLSLELIGPGKNEKRGTRGGGTAIVAVDRNDSGNVRQSSFSCMNDPQQYTPSTEQGVLEIIYNIDYDYLGV